MFCFEISFDIQYFIWNFFWVDDGFYMDMIYGNLFVVKKIYSTTNFLTFILLMMTTGR